MFAKKSQSNGVLLGVLIITIVSILVSACEAPEVTTSMIDPENTVDILNATVQINMYLLNNRENVSNNQSSADEIRTLISQGAGHFRGEGLGTLVNEQGQTVIITHDHWGELLRTADLVEILDAEGIHLRSMNNQDFRSLIILADSGTMVLFAPEGLDLSPVELGSSKINNGQELIVARRQPNATNQVDLVVAKVKNNVTYKNQEAFELQTLNGDHIVPGDSGGGVWLNGEIVGNNWAIEVVSQAGLFGEKTGEMVPNGTVYTAQLPIDLLDIVFTNNVVAEVVELENPQERIQE